jgi:hypothetical protein
VRVKDSADLKAGENLHRQICPGNPRPKQL